MVNLEKTRIRIPHHSKRHTTSSNSLASLISKPSIKAATQSYFILLSFVFFPSLSGSLSLLLLSLIRSDKWRENSGNREVSRYDVGQVTLWDGSEEEQDKRRRETRGASRDQWPYWQLCMVQKNRGASNIRKEPCLRNHKGERVI